MVVVRGREVTGFSVGRNDRLVKRVLLPIRPKRALVSDSERNIPTDEEGQIT